jgi:superfamily II DNA or RNA helicase
LLSNARNKFLKLRELLSGGAPTKLSLFYCGDGSAEDDDAGESLRQVEAVTSILRDNGWRSSLFTSRESRNERSTLLDFFRIGLIDSLVAIRCLDEGIDVPGCKVAYILASSRNPKQFIQRRGRILRRSPGKEFAEIHDFLVTVPEGIAQNSEFERSLLRYELERVAEFAKLSVNHAESIRTLSPLLERYSLSHLIA